MADGAKKEKIAILGGGIGALATAFEITEEEGWEEKYDLTVYQMGWRLGGKGASGRNMAPEYASRVEEHGIHVWGGYYQNAFRVMRVCYDYLNKHNIRQPDAPLGTYRKAFSPLANIGLVEDKYLELKDEKYKEPEKRWVNWVFAPPTEKENGEYDFPGKSDATVSIWTSITTVLDVMRERLKEAVGQRFQLGMFLLSLAYRLVKHTAEELSFIGRFLAFLVRYIAPIGRPLEYVVQLIVRLMLRMFVFLFWHHVKDHLDDDVKRQHWIFLNFAYGNLRGLLKSNVIRKGFKHLDEYDYREWLEHYMRPDGRITIESPLSWFLHEALFAYIDGDHKKPDLSASVALYTLIRTASTWNGAVVWRMNAGMGDVVFTPLYQVLKHRNVKFKFFHRVDKIHLSDDHNSISSISIGKQVKLTDEDTEYNPLTGVKDLQCWPSTPLWDQIEDGDRYESDGLNFEAWGTPDQADNIVLHAGEHFDKVVLGISIGALPYICCDLITSEKNPDASMRWKKMVDNVKTVRTQALQLWTKQDSKTMGWDETAEGKFANRPMVGTYIASRNLSTWADMTEIIEREDWPESEQHPGQFPKSLGYFCGVLSDDPPIQLSDCGPLQSAHELDQESANHKAKENGRSFLQKYIRQFWPKAANDGEFDWDLLVDNRTGDPTGKERIDSQYYRGNVSPTERYVLSTKGSQKHRIAPGQSGYDNLYLAGDWTDNAYNAGCIEATVMSGIQASNAINGFPRSKNVVGYAYGEPTRNREARPAKSNELLQEATAEARRGYFTFVTMFLVFLIPTIFTLRSVKTGLGITVDYSLLSIEEVEDWGVFFTILSKYGPDPTPSPSNRVWTYLSDPIRQDIKYLAGTAVEDSMQLRPVLGALNAIVMDPEFYDDPSFAGVSHEPKIRKEIEDFLGKLSDRSLTQVEIQRLNRLLLVSSYPNHVLVSEPMSPMGYTKSLLLFLLPVLVLGGWFLRIPRHERDILMHRKAFWQVVLFFTAGGLAMDIFLGSHFFWFPIKSAVSGIHLPWLFTYPELGFVSTLPIEEAGFYLLASLFVLLFYIWMDLSWFSEYNKNKYVVLIKEVPTVLAPHKRSLLWGFAVFFLAYWVKKNGIFGWENHYSEGFPGYLSVMIFSFITLTFFLFRTVKLFINWRAFTLSVFIMWLMSVIWEVTLALPYGWWRFHNNQMVGVFVNAWWGLPIEEPLLWSLAAWSIVMLYEGFKMHIMKKRLAEESGRSFSWKESVLDPNDFLPTRTEGVSNSKGV